MSYQKATSIEEVAANAILDAMDWGAETDEAIVDKISLSMGENAEVRGRASGSHHQTLPG